jgi:hypothetical protein
MSYRVRAMVTAAALMAHAAIAAGPPNGFQGQQRPQPNQFQQRDVSRQQMAPQPQRDPRADNRMSDEERRNLHRDLDRANREIYKGRQ